jgi:flagellar biosynthesis protein FlhG
VRAIHQAARLLQPPSSRAPAPWLAVTGGKGGVGKTVLAANLALLAQRRGHSTLLVDFDPGLGNLDVHLRLAPRHTLEDLAAGHCSPAEALLPAPGGLRLLAARGGSARLATDPAVLAAALHAVERAARSFDLVVCDTGAGIGPAVIEVLRHSQLALAITTPDPAAVTDCYALCKVLAGQGIATPALVVNRVRRREDAMRTAARLTAVSSKFLRRALPLLGWLSDDGAIEASVCRQRPLVLEGAGAALADLQALAAAALSALPGLQRSHAAAPATVKSNALGGR